MEDLNIYLTKMQETENKNIITSKLELDKLPKEEKNKLFKDKMRECGVTATWKWEDVERILHNESIWKSIKSFGEKRSLFSEFIRDCKTREREEQKLRKEKLKLKFRQMLEEDNTLNSDSKFNDVFNKFCFDERFRAVDKRDREDIFQDYIDLLLKKEEEEFKQERERKRKLFEKSLIEKNIPSDMKWNEIKEEYEYDPLFKSMEKIDQLQIFIDYITKLEKEENNKREEDEKYNAYRNREKFKDLLSNYLEQKKIDMKTKWKDFVKEIKDKEEYLNLLGQNGSTPYDFFNDLIISLKQEYKKNKAILKQILKNNTIKFSSNISYENYDEVLNKIDDYNKIKSELKSVLYEHLIKKLKEKEIEHQKREEKIANKLYSYIQRKKLNLTKDTTFEEALPEIKKQKKFINITEDHLRYAYNLLLKMLNSNNSIQINEEKEDGETSN